MEIINDETVQRIKLAVKKIIESKGIIRNAPLFREVRKDTNIDIQRKQFDELYAKFREDKEILEVINNTIKNMLFTGQYANSLNEISFDRIVTVYDGLSAEDLKNVSDKLKTEIWKKRNIYGLKNSK